MNTEQIIRVTAAVAAVAFFAYPFVLPYVQQFSFGVASSLKQKMRDIQYLVDLSSRLAGSKEGLDLCQKLIDVLLRQPK